MIYENRQMYIIEPIEFMFNFVLLFTERVNIDTFSILNMITTKVVEEFLDKSCHHKGLLY